MADWLVQWYSILSGLTESATRTFGNWSYGSRLPPLTALLLGVVGAASPCQLTTNVGALAYVCKGEGPGRTFKAALAYTLGKVTGYTVMGTAAVFLGLQATSASIPAVLIARKVLGPLMILAGLMLMKLVPFNISVGQGLAARLAQHAASRGARGAYVLGVAFSFSFCPTLFWLFFGLLVPLAISSSVGLALPGVFALGTALPFLAFAGLLGFGASKAQGYLRRAEWLGTRLRSVAGIVLIVVGIHDTVVYWAI
ncbi:MAG: sulfite exporter TauE/SafE family protein [Chloroflexi bacterium]|nr:sulfite exporter TauE/SafE family protein [Chloroflexota bacterium]